ncbi:MAG: hypothetical protein A2148_08490 [Chloroflexi bacterium RBG_16_68_14]|nr:MAG: hypothetical protein A2148_08490 [Chloroflexi bacterium RBG_16_68_14]
MARLVEIHYGQRKLQELAQDTGDDYGTVRNYRRVARRFPEGARRRALSFGHHEAVVSREEAEEWLARAERSGWSIRELRDAIRAGERHDPGPVPEGRFAVVYADPPWDFEDAKAHYDTQPTSEICDLGKQLEPHLPDDCWLFLWGLNQMMEAALQVLHAWGFRYVTTATWVKTKKDGMISESGRGRPLRNNTEQLLIGARGAPPCNSNEFTTAILAPRGQHSQKPDVAYGIIETISAGPYLELYARRRWNDQWTVWGNQTPGGEVGRPPRRPRPTRNPSPAPAPPPPA